MLSKALVLLASGAAVASAYMADAGQKAWPYPYNHIVGPSQFHHHPPGPSQYHHHPAVPQGSNGSKDDGPNLFKPTAGHGDVSPTLAITRGEPSASHDSKPTLAISRGSSGGAGSPDAGVKTGYSAGHLGPSQWHHHHPGPSQYHHHQPSESATDKNPYYGTPASSMHYNNDDDVETTNVHKGTEAAEYAPYVQSGSSEHPSGHNGVSSGGSWAGKPESGDVSPQGGDEASGNGPQLPGWGASASARARMAEKNKHDGMYALYGYAAADVCGLGEQMAGAEITACPLETGTGWDCLNLASTLESCGGCMSIGEGQDCTSIQGAEAVGCNHGKCVVGSCEVGYSLDSDKSECVAN